jgi:uncharacterized protein (TIGR03435 family)
MWLLLPLLLVVPPGGTSFGQPTAKLAFDVATVKPAETNDLRMSMDVQPSGRVIASATLKALIGFGYEVQDRNISGGPGWIDATAWRIEATSSTAPLTETQLRAMVRSLLEDRFRISARRESREESIYELLVAKDGPKLKAAAAPGPPRLSNGRGRIGGLSIDTGILTKMLSGRLGRAVIDKTGITGKFDVDLAWTPAPGERDDGDIAGQLANPDGPTMFTALQEQLGLRLQSGKGPVSTLVIERAEKPGAN